MKTQALFPLIIIMILGFSPALTAQQDRGDTIPANPQVIHVIIKNDNTRFIGEITYQDAREVIIRTENLGDVAVPKHEIREIRELEGTDLRTLGGDDLFTTRYFLTTNGLPIRKGESYIQWNLFGPDFQFGVADNIGIGIMTSWVAIPIIGTAKYSRQFNDKLSFAAGTLLGTGSWALPDFGIALPFVALTSGNRLHNVTLSTGYGLVFSSEETYNPFTDKYEKERFREGRFLVSVGGMTRVSPAISLVFDSFIAPPGPYRTSTEWDYFWDYDPVAENYTENYTEITTTERSSALMIFVPGIRWHTRPGAAFQFGFTGAYFDGEFNPVTVPMVQWFRKL